MIVDEFLHSRVAVSETLPLVRKVRGVLRITIIVVAKAINDFTSVHVSIHFSFHILKVSDGSKKSTIIFNFFSVLWIQGMPSEEMRL